jgi:hypothetical protein
VAQGNPDQDRHLAQARNIFGISSLNQPNNGITGALGFGWPLRTENWELRTKKKGRRGALHERHNTGEATTARGDYKAVRCCNIDIDTKGGATASGALAYSQPGQAK